MWKRGRNEWRNKAESLKSLCQPRGFEIWFLKGSVFSGALWMSHIWFEMPLKGWIKLTDRGCIEVVSEYTLEVLLLLSQPMRPEHIAGLCFRSQLTAAGMMGMPRLKSEIQQELSNIFSFYHQRLKCSWGTFVIYTGETVCYSAHTVVL